MTYRLGGLPRLRLPHVPHLSSIVAGLDLPPLPASCDWTQALSGSLGVMLNDQLGDCTCAAWGHAVQVWTANTGKMLTLPDSDIEDLYELACGYKPGDASTDQGGVEQLVLSYLVRNGLAGHELSAFVEVDLRNLDDVKRAIWAAGVAYIGFQVPDYLMSSLTAPGSDWDTRPGPVNIDGGHAVILAGYGFGRFKVISWGQQYTMTERFLQRYCDEVYMLADTEWLTAKGMTPLGQTLTDLEQQMRSLKEAA